MREREREERETEREIDSGKPCVYACALVTNCGFRVHFISVAVMRQVRSQLLREHFNELVLFFSQMHQSQKIDMEAVVRDAVKFARITPRSLCTDQAQDDARRWWEQKTPLGVLQQHFR